jgi:antitoxin VapB
MALNLKNKNVERLVEDVVALTGENKTEAIRKALEERKQRLSLQIKPHYKNQRIMEFLNREVWSIIPPQMLGHRISKKEKEKILGYGKNGV